jgi:3'5'-cyclic nucleotide phosphodiesterase
MKENATIAAVYNNKSIAEQNSLDIGTLSYPTLSKALAKVDLCPSHSLDHSSSTSSAWELLMDPQFVDLRAAIYTNKSEYYHFRQLLVNAVMATDIMDKDAGAFRKQRWEKAFSEQAKAEVSSSAAVSDGARGDKDSSGAPSSSSSSSLDAVNRKATIVIEHLIQASDVSHTMQHWHIYSKWNERLFEEMYRAYQQGRADKDPSESWYQGEMGFFDYYVIPLAKKLKACGVFGVSSDEYLNYAVSNRKEWEAVGRERVEAMVAKFAPAAAPAAATVDASS